MMSFKINVIGKGKVEASTVSVFGSLKDVEVKEKLLAEVIRCELLSLRAGNAHTKVRGEVRGGGKKPWKQKGTGRARHGSTRSPIWVGGGVTFGPRNTRNWERKINKSAKLSALKSIFKDRLNEKAVYQFVDSFKFEKTKDAATTLEVVAKKEEVKTKSIVIVYTSGDKPNLKGFTNTDVQMINATQLKICKLANAKVFVLTPAATELIEERFEKKKTVAKKEVKEEKAVKVGSAEISPTKKKAETKKPAAKKATAKKPATKKATTKKITKK